MFSEKKHWDAINLASASVFIEVAKFRKDA
jgi:hypothetical protein